MLDELFYDGESGWTVTLHDPEGPGQDMQTDFAPGIDEDALDKKAVYDCDSHVPAHDIYGPVAAFDEPLRALVTAIGEITAHED
jgi:hypothetical protein